MTGNKTVETDTSVENFINSVDNDQKRKDSWGRTKPASPVCTSRTWKWWTGKYCRKSFGTLWPSCAQNTNAASWSGDCRIKQKQGSGSANLTPFA